MAEEEDFLYRPLLRGMFKAESLYDGTLNLLAITKLNESLDVEYRNNTILSKKD